MTVYEIVDHRNVDHRNVDHRNADHRNVDQSKPCAQKNACCINLQILIPFIVNSIISDMHLKTYVYINYQ